MSEDAQPAAGGHAESLDRIEQDLAAVEAALQRLDDGTYGRCATCGAAISEDDLSRDPLAGAGAGAGDCAEHRAPATTSERAVGVFAGDDPLALGREHPEG